MYATRNVRNRSQSVRTTQFLTVLFLILFSYSFKSHAQVSSLERHGITWTFQTPVAEGNYGQFANGDYWVVGPVTITSITPGSSGQRNGAMINPALDADQGFDDRVQYATYSGSANVADNLPLTVNPGSSLVSSISAPSTVSVSHPSYIRQVDILTVLSAPAQAGDFRPPYVGTNKTISWNTSDLDYSQLASLAQPNSGANVPSLSGLVSEFEYAWFEMNDGWTGRYLHPELSFPDGNYGREIAHLAGEAVLSLQLNYSNAQKEDLLIRIVQAGIDIYGLAAYGGFRWDADGGHNVGRKMIMLLAAKVLNNTDMLNLANPDNGRIFQEDQQTFYVTQADIDRSNSSDWNPDTRGPTQRYSSEDIGLAEWGIRHSNDPYQDNRHWGAYYRNVAGAPTVSNALAAILMGVEEEWNNPALFDYYDRYYSIESPYASNGSNSIRLFARDMYEAYRNLDQATVTATPNILPIGGTYLVEQTVTISSSTPDSTIYYTLDGSMPTSSSMVYSGEFTVNSTTEIRAIAMSEGRDDSSVAVANLNFLNDGGGELVSDSFWGNLELPTQSENFNISFTLTPSANNIDGVTGLSLNEADSYSDLAVIIRLNNSGQVDARNGSTYSAVSTLNYSANNGYAVDIEVNFTSGTYNAFVTPEGGSRTTIAQGYAFRSEQSGTTSINNLGYFTSGDATHTISNIEIGGAGTSSPPNPPTNVRPYSK